MLKKETPNFLTTLYVQLYIMELVCLHIIYNIVFFLHFVNNVLLCYR